MATVGFTPFSLHQYPTFVPFHDGLPNHLTHHYPHLRHVSAPSCLHLGAGIGEVKNSPDKFSVNVDVSHFNPDEVRVHLDGNVLMIEGSHQEKVDEHGSIQRSFIRKYILPDDANMEALRSSLSDKGHLTVEAPKKTNALSQPKAIPITRA